MKGVLPALLLLAAAYASAQVCAALGPNGYIQDFNSLATTGTANTSLPEGWSLREVGTSARNNSAYAADDGSDTSGDVYSYGAAGSSDRALGTLLSGTLSPTVGVCLRNRTGSTVSRLRVSYLGKQFRLGTAGRADRLQFQVSLDSTSLATGFWRSVPGLDLLSPETTQTGRITPPATVPVSGEFSIADLEPGAAIHLRWTDIDATGADDGLAIDDLRIDAIAAPPDPRPVVPISRIQGPGGASPLAGRVVATRGIVTHRKTNGFFLQTPDGEDDGDPSTSEGVFVFTGLAPPPEAQPGALVGVTGLIDEFRPGADPASPPLTELKDLEGFSPISAGNPLPRPVAIGAGDLSPWGAVDQLERFESMRVRLDALDVVGPTEGRVQAASASSISAGVFHGVLPGTPRPFREPGIEVHEPPVDACCAPYFDANPERVRVFAPSLEVAVGDRVEGVVGPLDFAERTYTVLADEGAVARSGGVGPRPAPRGQFSIGAFNLERFYNDRDDPGGDTVLAPAAYQRRLAKASLAIRGLLGMPDVLALAEVENLDTLRDLARRIDSDQAASGAPPPGYAAHLVEGNDPSLINVGYLVKPAVVVESVVQRGAADTFINPLTSAPAILFDRPPLVLRISRPFELTLIAVHLLSLLDVADPAAGPRARAKRRAQAEAVARLAQEAQSRGPVAVLGDFNAFPFNDGYVDVVGTIRGAPTPADRVALASPDLVEPDLFDAALALPPPERYSYVFRGNAQQIDHILLSADLVPRLAAFGYARVNADHPDSLRNDASRPERVSDHDAPVAVFNPR